MKTRKQPPEDQGKAESIFVTDGPQYFGLYLEIDGEPVWLEDQNGWLIHYPSQAIAEAHASKINLRSSRSRVVVKPFSN